MQKTAELSNLTLYRHLLRYAKVYPSVKQAAIYQDIRALFKENRNLTEAKLIQVERKKALMGLAHLQMYHEKNEELKTAQDTTPGNYESLNPRDENFIYF